MRISSTNAAFRLFPACTSQSCLRLFLKRFEAQGFLQPGMEVSTTHETLHRHHGWIRILQPSELFLFKLHAPLNVIAGGGFFVRYSQLPLSVTWEVFGVSNGAGSYAACLALIQKHRKTNEADPVIGCRILTSLFFLPKDQWIPVPESFRGQIVQGKSYETSEPEGAALLEQVWQRLQADPRWEASSAQPGLVQEGKKFGAPYLFRPRLGQGAFRVLVTEAYERRCALTGERTLPVLDAAHIRPYTEQGPHDIRNGLLMRSDLHKLFDRGYLTVRPDLTIDVSSRIVSEYANGKIYYALQDRPLAVVPVPPLERPSPYFLQWHNQQVFRP